MSTLEKITQDLKLWEQEYTHAKEDYTQFVNEYKQSHPHFAERLEKVWKETNEQFWGIEVKFRKSYKKASQQKEPQKSLDRYRAKLVKKHARKRALQKFEAIKEEMLNEALLNNEVSSEIPNRFKELKNRYKRAKNQKANLNRTLKSFLNSNIFKERITSDSDYIMHF